MYIGKIYKEKQGETKILNTNFKCWSMYYIYSYLKLFLPQI